MSFRPLGDISTRNNILGRRRQSLGGTAKNGAMTPEKMGSAVDESNNYNGCVISSAGRISSEMRRQSLSGEMSRHETPIRDRRAMLEAWRQARAGRATDVGDTKKRSRNEPLLPPSHSLTPNPRKSLKTIDHSQETDTSSQISFHASNQYIHDDETETYTKSSSLRTAHTPVGRNGMLGSARRSSLLGKSVCTLNGLSQQEVFSQLSQEHESETPKLETVDSVEGVGLLSQMERMKQRLEQLEKEKMILSMSKAPLEARFAQKEDIWNKERGRLVQEIETSKQALREADEKYRDIQFKYEQAYDECIQLRQEVRKVASSRHGNNENNLWSRQLQNDRELAEMREKVRTAEEEINSIRLAKASLEKELHGTRIELNCLERNFQELRAEYVEISARSSENSEAEIKLQVLTEEHMATSAALNAVYAELDATKARAEATMEEKEKNHKKEVEQLQFDLSVIRTRASKIQLNIEKPQLEGNDVEDEAVLRARIEERDKRIAELESQLLHGEQLRRQMHNAIQELRGNVRVYVRTRPFLPGDEQTNDSPINVCPDGESLTIVDRRNGSPFDFRFDKVFPPSAGQDIVFDEVSDFVQSALDGYHVCLFSYGQTGSGKTHTMQGCGSGNMRGIIPRAVQKILSQARLLTQQKWNFTISASFLEIYNEDLRDLLLPTDCRDKSKMKSHNKLAIKRNREGRSYVDGLTTVPIDTHCEQTGMDQLESLMQVAARARSVASTKMNSQSSRSHSVFMLYLNGYNDESGAVVSGALNLCDLAGSERLDRSGAGADAARLKETQAINKSLSCLGDVFNALATGASHVPYRNSKLTYLLQDCLSGDGKALMFVNLSPTTASSSESLCSIRFAQRVNQVELGKATKHIQFTARNKR